MISVEDKLTYMWDRLLEGNIDFQYIVDQLSPMTWKQSLALSKKMGFISLAYERGFVSVNDVMKDLDLSYWYVLKIAKENNFPVVSLPMPKIGNHMRMVRLGDIKNVVAEQAKYMSETISVRSTADSMTMSWTDFMRLATRAGLQLTGKRVSKDDMAKLEAFRNAEIEARPISIENLARKMGISFHAARKLRLAGKA